jgi:putative aminopeptidase FrvX
MTDDDLFQMISEMVMCHSPSGVEGEIDAYLTAALKTCGVDHWQDAAGNLIAKIVGRKEGAAVAITAHKDEIGAIVKSIDTDGKIRVRRLGGAFPWVYGEGVVDLLGDRETVSGVLSFGSRHVCHESPQKVQQDEAALTWEAAWVDAKRSPAQLAQAGVRPGTRMVVGKHRKKPFRLGDFIASYALDNKASLAVLLTLVRTLRDPAVDVYLVASAQEEVGAIGAMFFTQREALDALIALEICPKSPEYPIADDQAPVLIAQDGYGMYSEALNGRLMTAAAAIGVPVQSAVLSGFGSDGSIAMKAGHVAQAACLGFPADNTHGYEIAHLQAIRRCGELLEAFCCGSNRR